MAIKVGTRVNIIDGYYCGEWGIVQHIDEDNFYHVAMYGDNKMCVLCERDEIDDNESFKLLFTEQETILLDQIVAAYICKSAANRWKDLDIVNSIKSKIEAKLYKEV